MVLDAACVCDVCVSTRDCFVKQDSDFYCYEEFNKLTAESQLILCVVEKSSY